MITPPFPGLGVTSLPGLIFWFVLLSMSLSSPLGLSLLTILTPPLLFPRPRLVPFPAPCCVPRPRCLPLAGIPQSPLPPPTLVSSSPASSGKLVGAVWAKPPAIRTVAHGTVLAAGLAPQNGFRITFHLWV